MLHRFVVAVGAGCAAALLFAVSAQSSVLAMALAYLAPLPIMIATLGWGLDAGAIAGVISVAALALLSEPLSALLFAASVAGPAWALAAFSITPIARYFRGRRPDAPVHPSVGAVVTLAAVFGIIGSAGVLTTIIVVYGGYREGAREIASAVAALAADAFDGAPDKLSARDFADALVRFGPPAIAASTLMMLCVNLYAAARSTQLSHNLPRPWPDLPKSLALPWPLGVAFLACLALAYVLPSPPPSISRPAPGGSAAPSCCRDWRSPMRCRAVSR